jgi:cation-transporting ATPase E
MVSGSELEQMSEAEFDATAESAQIFGRITPQQKERLVRSLRQQGHYVAMIGDGVNDVLSMKQADLGIAMRSGSQAARGVADVVLMQDSFAVLVPAVAEGQRILNGMQDILKLFLTRISTVALVILSSLVVGAFPLELRQGSLVTLFSVGIPAILLAVWARPGPSAQGHLTRQLLHFILPPVLITSVLGLLLYVGSYALWLVSIGSFGARNGIYQLDDYPAAQTTLTTFLVFCGLFLVIFVEPPTPWWAGGNRLSGDWRPTLLAVGMMGAFVVITLIPALRALFVLSPLGWRELLLIASALGAWLFAVRATWRLRLLGRYLGVSAS